MRSGRLAGRAAELIRPLLRSLRVAAQSGRHHFWLLMGCQVVAAGALLLQLGVTRSLLGDLVAVAGSPAGRLGPLIPKILLLGGLLLASSLAAGFEGDQRRLLADLIGQDAQARVLRTAAHVELEAFERPDFHDRLQRAQLNSMSKPLQVAGSTVSVVGAALAIAGLATSLVVTHPVPLLLLLAGHVPVAIVAGRTSRGYYALSRDLTPVDRERMSIVSLTTGRSSAKEIRAYGLDQHLQQRFDRLFSRRLAAVRSVVRQRRAAVVVSSLFLAGLSTAALVLLADSVVSGHTSVAAGVTAAVALMLLGQRVRVLLVQASALYESSLFLEDCEEFLVPAISPAAAGGPATPPHAGGFDELSADHLSFAYPASTEALRDVTLELRRGELVCLVGPNGSGKTTLVKILAGLYAPHAGQLRVDGRPLTGRDRHLLNGATAVVFQDYVRYLMTLRENIGLGDPDRLDDIAAIHRASELVGLDRTAVNLPRGYESLLGPEFVGGTELSGGQWQKVAIARAAFRDKPFLIFDEPTSGLDPVSRAAFPAFLHGIRDGHTVLVISHDLSIAPEADRILVMDGGVIRESGTHDQLLAGGGIYAAMHAAARSARGEP